MTQNSAPTTPTTPAEDATESDRSLLAAELALGILSDAEAEETRRIRVYLSVFPLGDD